MAIIEKMLIDGLEQKTILYRLNYNNETIHCLKKEDLLKIQKAIELNKDWLV